MSIEVKREIIGMLLQRGIIVTKDILTGLNKVPNIPILKTKIQQEIETGQLNQDNISILINKEFLTQSSAQNTPTQTNQATHIQTGTTDQTSNINNTHTNRNNRPDQQQDDLFKDVEPGNVEILFTYELEPKKREVKDFLGYFRSRYDTISKMLMPRTELKNLTSISRLQQKRDRGEVSIIGMILEKQTTHTGKIIMTLEDPSGTVKVMVSPDRDCFETANESVLDEVIAVVGNAGDGIIFANNMILPDIPLFKELKKSPEEEYALFIGDFHFGSNVFLYEPFEKFMNWLSGDANEANREIIKKIKYIFLVGDLVEGVGIYPGQEADLDIQDIYQQYEELSKHLARIPKHMKIIICPGNHDAMRIAEPQPPLYKDFAKAVWDLPNVIMTSNPAMVNIAKKEGFPGFDVLLYHGFSFPYYADRVESIRSQGGQDRSDLIMKFLLQRRHLAPEHKSTLYLPDEKKDSLVIDKVPDIFASGHVHKVSASNYRNVTLLNCSAWLKTTEYQEKLGITPHPGKAILMNLKTRKPKLLKFYDEEKEKLKAEEEELEQNNSKQ